MIANLTHGSVRGYGATILSRFMVKLMVLLIIANLLTILDLSESERHLMVVNLGNDHQAGELPMQYI